MKILATLITAILLMQSTVRAEELRRSTDVAPLPSVNVPTTIAELDVPEEASSPSMPVSSPRATISIASVARTSSRSANRPLPHALDEDPAGIASERALTYGELTNTRHTKRRYSR